MSSEFAFKLNTRKVSLTVFQLLGLTDLVDTDVKTALSSTYSEPITKS